MSSFDYFNQSPFTSRIRSLSVENILDEKETEKSRKYENVTEEDLAAKHALSASTQLAALPRKPPMPLPRPSRSEHWCCFHTQLFVLYFVFHISTLLFQEFFCYHTWHDIVLLIHFFVFVRAAFVYISAVYCFALCIYNIKDDFIWEWIVFIIYHSHQHCIICKAHYYSGGAASGLGMQWCLSQARVQ